MGLFSRRKVVHLPDLPPSPIVAPAGPPLADRLGLCVGLAQDHLPWVKDLGIKYIRMPVFGGLWKDAAYRESVLVSMREYDSAEIHGIVVIHDTPTFSELHKFGMEVAEILPVGWLLQYHNEMNIISGFNPQLLFADPLQRGDEYADYLMDFAVDTDALLVVGGLVGDPRDFLRGMSWGDKPKPSRVAVHCYGYPPYNQLTQRVAELREVVPDAKIYCTEIGSEGGVTNAETYQLDLEGTVTTLMRDPCPITRAYWYSLDSADGFGLVKNGYTTTSYHWLKERLHA